MRRWMSIGHVLRMERNNNCMVAMEWQPERTKKRGFERPHGEGQWKRGTDRRVAYLARSLSVAQDRAGWKAKLTT